MGKGVVTVRVGSPGAARRWERGRVRETGPPAGQAARQGGGPAAAARR